MSDANRGRPDGQSISETKTGEPVTIGPYRVLSMLGVGGMGQVFRARDSKLNRDVALKLLPDAFANDPDRLARFAREAQALAALNHPNVAAIYGLEESSGRPALVLELVEGPTLAARIADGPLPLRDALSIARQIAEGLNAAHEKGIIHRDLKPANVKVTASGVVKVLDFGLAKTSAPDIEATDFSQSPTMVASTRVGVVLGTASYMSPEQARAQPVDARTDIWAFGCVLFEMLSGKKTFPGDGISDSIAKILEAEPEWSALPKSTPAKARELLRRCLEKDPHKRPATIASARATIEQLLAPRALLSRRSQAALSVAAVVALIVAIYAWARLDRNPIASVSDWVQLTRLDSATQPALSPDGRMLAFIRGPSTFVAPGQLYVKLLPDGEPVQLTHDDLPKMGPVFSPDGGRIAYTVNDGSAWDTWDVPALRGEPRRWLRNASGLTWIAADDLLFSEVKTGIHMAIVRSSEARANARDLYVPPHDSGMAHRSAVSPDGARALVVEMNATGIWTECRLLTIDGRSSQLVGPPQARCTNAAWAPDGRWMYFTADKGDGFHVWRQRDPDGVPEQLTSGPTEEEGLAIASNGRSLITSVGVTQRSVWLHDASGDRQVSLEGYAYFPLLSADGQKICFRLTRGVGTGQSPSELWLADIKSGQTHRLFPGQMITGYDISRDDKVVAAVQGPEDHRELWLAALDDREPAHRIPDIVGDNPRFGPDGAIWFRKTEGQTAFMYRMRQDGTSPERLFEASATVFGTVSPAGEWLSGISRDNSQTELQSKRRRQPLFPYSFSSRVRWTPDGKRAYLSLQYGQASSFGTGRTFVFPLAKESVLPVIPPDGFRTEQEIAATTGVESIPYGDVALGSTAGVYTYSRITTTRNLYRIPLR
jgi:eukaryotic-like serine/threonine-protein kinase